MKNRFTSLVGAASILLLLGAGCQGATNTQLDSDAKVEMEGANDDIDGALNADGSVKVNDGDKLNADGSVKIDGSMDGNKVNVQGATDIDAAVDAYLKEASDEQKAGEQEDKDAASATAGEELNVYGNIYDQSEL